MVQQYGADRFKRGLRAAVMASKFFPGPAEIAEHMPEPEPIGTLADKDCSLCSGTGWKQVQGDAGKLKVGRCDCWIRNRGKLETA